MPSEAGATGPWARMTRPACCSTDTRCDNTFDRVRVAGLWWVGTLDGRVTPRDPEALPAFIELEDLGITDTESGWMAEGDFALARRHRVRMSGSDRSSDGMTTLTVNADIGGIEIPVQVPITSSLRVREFEATYNYLVVANSTVDVGVLGGLGYFDATASASTPLGDADEQFNTPYPTLGGNLLVNPMGRFRGYVEFTGFPQVTVDDFSGWKASFIARAEVFITENVGAYVGYRTYEIDLKDEDIGADFNFLWKGLIVGGAVRF